MRGSPLPHQPVTNGHRAFQPSLNAYAAMAWGR